LALLTTVFDYPVSMIGLSHAQRSNTLPPTIALLALAVWQCGAMLIFEKPANRWLLRPRVWLGVVVANSMVMTFYLWNMTAAVLAAVILLPTGIAPQFEELSARGGCGGSPGSERARSASCRSCSRSGGPNGPARRHLRRRRGGAAS